MTGRTAILLLLACVCCGAERQYYLQSNESGWEEARLHCQVCFKELVSLTADNMQVIVRNLTSNYWVGLRKDINGSMPWSRWSNDDPVTFQNWYPGHPKPPQPPPKPEPTLLPTTSPPLPPPSPPPPPPANVCSIHLQDFCKSDINITNYANMSETVELDPDVCVIRFEDICASITNKTAPANNTEPEIPNTTEPANVTDHWTTPSYNDSTVTVEGEEEEVPEKLCVSLLSFGMWLEKNCTDYLPYICYEDRFYGTATVSNVTLYSMSLNWLPGPGDIELYRVELRGDSTLIQNTTNLTMDFDNLTAGTLYRVQVFPIKCGRDLNPQNVSFYTRSFKA
ncbi:uncharacterized protein LOC118791175 [Megalops cyprinoides]|uniref:uncharacterized protein LOC118791175 n=1 Tax=Megalops cyprinoides TaxID=118141 RepID=UPI001863E8E2|nr:uncharacterized protein LOC118791175 [Megalops cyprinoides]